MLNSNQKRHLLTTFKHVDKLLQSALNELTLDSGLCRHIPDVAPIQRKEVENYVIHLRRLMLSALEHFEIQLDEPVKSTLWAFRTAVLYSKISIEEIAPKYMRGFGGLSEDAIPTLNAIKATLCECLDNMDAYLATDTGKDLRARLQKLDQDVIETEWLRQIERVVTAQGLVGLRPTLEMLIERTESPKLEIAVFGKVSSGKSSLVNYLLQDQILPVGVLPVTSLTIQISYGSTARAHILFADKSEAIVRPEEVACYATEQTNPENTKHVTKIALELPKEIVKGITFVDTPGLGSLSQSDEEAVYTYLPRCDIGLVLIDVSSKVMPEDVEIINSLFQAGAEVMVLLSKADTISSEDRLRLQQYTSDRLKSLLNRNVQVFTVSVIGDNKIAFNQSLHSAFNAWLSKRKELTRISLRQKIVSFRDTVIKTLKHRLLTSSGKTDSALEHSKDIAAMLHQELILLEKALNDPIGFDTSDFYERIIKDIQDHIKKEVCNGNSVQGGLSDIVRGTVDKHLNQLATNTAKGLQTLRGSLLCTLHAAASEIGDRREHILELPDLYEMPIPQFPLPDKSMFNLRILNFFFLFSGERITQLYVKRYSMHWIRKHVPLYGSELERWRIKKLNEIRKAYRGCIEQILSQSELPLQNIDVASLEHDLELLQTLDNTIE